MSKQNCDGPHPRREPRLPGELTLERVKEIFAHSADFACRTVALGGGESPPTSAIWWGWSSPSGSTTM